MKYEGKKSEMKPRGHTEAQTNRKDRVALSWDASVLWGMIKLWAMAKGEGGNGVFCTGLGWCPLSSVEANPSSP
jgi:hypothetical protein